MGNFAYSYTSITTDQIRLILLSPGSWQDTISCKIHIVNYGTTNQYEALSYVWGNEANKSVILVDDCRVEVTPTLESVLRHLRSVSEERLLRVDQLCIDQSNEDEKSKQVGLMDHIFENASDVLIWLGDLSNQPVDSLSGGSLTSNEVKNAFELVSLLSVDLHLGDLRCFQLLNGDRLEVAQGYLTAFDVLHRLMHWPWWTRIWTVQEVVLSRQAVVFIGFQCIRWSELESAALNIRKHLNSCCMGPFGTLSLSHRIAIDDFYLPIFDIARYREQHRLRNPPDLIPTLHRFRNRLATDARDKIYGLLGLQKHATLVADYHRNFTRIYIDLMMQVIIDENNLGVLLDDKPDKQQQLPSWVIDWRTPVNSSRLRVRLLRYDKYRCFPYLLALLGSCTGHCCSSM
jgi:hypothetical protein